MAQLVEHYTPIEYQNSSVRTVARTGNNGEGAYNVAWCVHPIDKIELIVATPLVL